MNYLLIAICQFLFSLFRTLNTRYTAKDKIYLSLTTSTFVKCTWLCSTYLGLKGIADGDLLTAFVYVFFGVLGDRLAFVFKNK